MAFLFRLETIDGDPAEPATLTSAVPNWGPGDTIPLGQHRTLRAVGVRHDDADNRPTLGLAVHVQDVVERLAHTVWARSRPQSRAIWLCG